MKLVTLILLFVLSTIKYVFPQVPSIQWQKCYGGSSGDGLYSIAQTIDSGFIICGSSTSNDGDVTGNHGSEDCWILKTNSLGTIEWQKSYGGSSDEHGNAILQTSDSGYIFAGGTTSNDNDVSGNHGNSDLWIVKTSATGNIIWQHCYGGSSYEEAFSISKTYDGGYLACGYTFSNDGDVSGLHGFTESDIWVVKIDSMGGLQWQKCLGGSNGEGELGSSHAIITTDSGYIITGKTLSNDGDVVGNNGSIDYWVVKLNMNGGIQWQKCLGGSFVDESYFIVQASDGGFAVVGSAASIDGDVTGNHGSAGDYWIVKLDNFGNIEWQTCYGGSNWDLPYSIQNTNDSGYVVMGQSYSFNGDVVGHHGDTLLTSLDYWLIKIDSTGGLQWQKCLGGTYDDFGQCIIQTSDSGYVAAGSSFSNDGDVSGNHGGNADYWVIKLSPLQNGISTQGTPKSDLTSYYSQEINSVVFSFYALRNEIIIFQLYDMAGRLLLSKFLTVEEGASNQRVYSSKLNSGAYIVKLVSDDGVAADKLIVQ